MTKVSAFFPSFSALFPQSIYLSSRRRRVCRFIGTPFKSFLLIDDSLFIFFLLSIIRFLIVDAHQLSILVEFQFEVVRQFYIVTIALFVDFDDGGTCKVGFHIVGDAGRYELGRNGVVVAVHFVPGTIFVEVQFHSVV